MTDAIIKGDGNSRYLKTVQDALSRYPTHESLVQALVEGTFPIDLNGINAAGWTQQGTPLNKANLLSDATVQSIFGSISDKNVDQALSQLRSLVTTAQNTANTANSAAGTAQSTANAKARVEYGSYVGTISTSSMGSKTLTLSINPSIVFIASSLDSSLSYWNPNNTLKGVW